MEPTPEEEVSEINNLLARNSVQLETLPLPSQLEDSAQKLEKSLSDYIHQSDFDITTLRTVKDLAEDVADQLRDLRYRGLIGSNTNLIPNTINAIKKTIPLFELKDSNQFSYSLCQFIKHHLRVIGNLVHTLDSNRQKCLDADGASAIQAAAKLFLRLIQANPHGYDAEIQVVLIVGTNLCLDYQPAQVALAQTGLTTTVAQIIEFAYSRRLKWMSFPIILLDELSSIEPGWSRIPESLPGTLAKMTIHYATAPNDTEEKSSDDNVDIQAAVMCSHTLYSIVEHATALCFTSWLFETAEPSFMSFSDDIRPPMWLHLMQFLRYGHGGVEAASITDLPDDSVNLYSHIKANIIRSMVLAISCACMLPHGKEVMFDYLVSWIEDDQILKDRVDLLIMAGLWLGNLACDTESCRVLVEKYKILQVLPVIFRFWTPSRMGSEPDLSSNKVRPGEQVQILHAYCGLARNLAVGDAYKTQLGQIGLVTYALECLRPEFNIVEPLNGAAATLLRHLCRNHPENVQKVIKSGQVDLVVNLAKRTEQPFLIMEASRLLCTIIIAANRIEPASISSDFSNNQATVEDEMKCLYSESTVEILVRFAYISVSSHHLVLINEALVSLALLAARPELAPPLCQSLVKIRMDSSPETELVDDQNARQELHDDSKNYKTCLDALLSVLISSKQDIQAEKQGGNGSTTHKRKTSAQVQDVQVNDSTSEVHKNDGENSSLDDDDFIADLLVQKDEDQSSKTVPPVAPFEMKQNVIVLLCLLGDQVMLRKNDQGGSSTEDSKLGGDITSSFTTDLQEMERILLKHSKVYHQTLDSNHQTETNASSLEQSRVDNQSSHEETLHGFSKSIHDLKLDGLSHPDVPTISDPELRFIDILKIWKIDSTSSS